MVIGVEPVEVQRRKLPDQLDVAVPVRRNDRGRQTVGDADEVDPAVEVEERRLRFICS